MMKKSDRDKVDETPVTRSASVPVVGSVFSFQNIEDKLFDDPKSAIDIYGNKYEKYQLGSELRLKNGETVDFVLVHEIMEKKIKIEKKSGHTETTIVSNEVPIVIPVRDKNGYEVELRDKLKALNYGPVQDQEHHKNEEEVNLNRLWKRYCFECALRRDDPAASIEQEYGKDPKTVFTKIHFSFERLCKMAEEISLDMDLVENEQIEMTEDLGMAKVFTISPLKKFIDKFNFLDNGLKEPVDLFAAPFRLANMSNFQNFDKPEKFFSSGQRGTLADCIVNRIRYGKELNQLGIRKLVQNGTYKASFPLHDGPVPLVDDPTASENKTKRGILYQRWGRLKAIYKRQPLEEIRQYFGEKIGFYFAFLGYYTFALMLPAFVGLWVFFAGVGQSRNGSQEDITFVCQATDIIMCSKCEACKEYTLASVCGSYQWSYVFDNAGTIFFSIFMSIWSSVFVDMWKRQTSILAYKWDVRNLTIEEADRPEFRGIKGKDGLEPDPVTHKMRKTFPKAKRVRRYIISFTLVFFYMSVVICVALAIIVYRLAVTLAAFKSNSVSLQANAAIISSVTAAIFNLMAITILDNFYVKLAKRLTAWENHRKDSEYESFLATKIFVFSFVNTYSSLIYVAFFKGQIGDGYPGNYNFALGFRQDECPAFGCLLELTIQLTIIMVGKQLISNLTEWVAPRIKHWWVSRKTGGSTRQTLTRLPWEEQYLLLPQEELGFFFEYREMIMQFGFVTLFVACFPLSPFFAFLNNIFEIRIDANKYLTNFRRPRGLRALDIGIWMPVLEFLSVFSVITNGLVIAFTSTYITKLVYYYNYAHDFSGYPVRTHPFFELVMENVTTVGSNYTLKPYLNSANRTEGNCSFTTNLESTGEKGVWYYQVWACKLGFLVLFEHFVFIVKFFVQAIIPDVPRDIALKIKREVYIATAQYEQEVFDGDKPADSATMPTMSTPRRNSRNSLTLKKEALSLETASDSSIPAVSLSPTLSPSAMLTDIIEDSSTSA